MCKAIEWTREIILRPFRRYTAAQDLYGDMIWYAVLQARVTLKKGAQLL